MVIEHIVTTAGTAKSAAYVATVVADAAEATTNTKSTVYTSALLTIMQEKLAARTVYAYGGIEDYTDTKFAPSPVLSLLVRGLRYQSDSSRILYAPPSSGKTAATKSWMKTSLKKFDIPALMFTGAGNTFDYLQSIVNCFPGAESNPTVVMKCLLGALSRSATAKQGSPWLILDEFNHEGEDGINMVFAENLFRQVAERKLNFSVLFITQKLSIADALLEMNCWQKIAPLPFFTSPDARDVTSAEKVPKREEFKWLPIRWTKRQLSMVVFQRYPTLEIDRSLTTQDEDGANIFAELEGDESPTAAMAMGASALNNSKRGEDFEEQINSEIVKTNDTSKYL